MQTEPSMADLDQSPPLDLGLPESMVVRRHDTVALIRLDRPAKRNALNDATVQGIGRFFADPPSWARAAVLHAQGEHFCAGLDLNELTDRSTMEGVHHSRMWHRAFGAVEHGRLPVVSVLHGAVIGGGLELACATHIRVAEPTAMYALPEAQRGLFVGGGGSVRLPRLIGTARVMDMMLTGRVLSGREGQDVGISQYLVDEGAGQAQALRLAQAMAGNAEATNFAVLQALPRIAESDPEQGLLLEAMAAAICSGSAEAKELMGAFLGGRAAKVARSTSL